MKPKSAPFDPNRPFSVFLIVPTSERGLLMRKSMTNPDYLSPALLRHSSPLSGWRHSCTCAVADESPSHAGDELKHEDFTASLRATALRLGLR
jgi:hypothetical protein